MQTQNLTDSYVSRLPPAVSGQYVVRDSIQPNFFVVVGAKLKTYTVQITVTSADGKRTSKRKAIGKSEDISARVARTLARQKITELQVNQEEANLPTSSNLYTAWQEYKAMLIRNNRAIKTIEGYEHHVEVYFEEWHKTTLLDLAKRPEMVVKMHRKLSQNRGNYAANGAMRTLSAVYNEKARTELSLRGLNPTEAVRFNPEVRRQTALTPYLLITWFEQLDKFDNEIRRYFHLIMLITGSRPEALRRSRWSDIDLERKKWHFKKPKGGEGRAFDIPISPRLQEILEQLRIASISSHPMSGKEFLFPAFSRTGHVEEHKEPHQKLSHWGGDLRQSFRTFATMAGVNEVFIRILMNHKSNDVSVGYLNLLPMWNSLIDAQSAIIQEIEKLGERSIR